ncbi:MAG: PmoA family protein [Pirellulales bacterium]
MSDADAAEFVLEKHDRGVTVKLDGELFTEYLIKAGPKPILWPIIGPTGKPMTRAYPMEKVDGEKHDHPHHRSFWFTHGDVNGLDFWSEGNGRGTTVHREYRKVEGGPQSTISVAVDWLGPDGKRVLEDERTYTFRLLGDQRVIDFDITLRASDGPVKFGDTKEGTFGVRVPTAMDSERRGQGEIVNSEGETSRSGSPVYSGWGKPVPWVDYHGAIDGEVVGIAILNHPQSFRFPTRWHVRSYGLFAANPFGLHDFPKVPGSGGEYTLPNGESIALRYRVIFHRGDGTAAEISKRFSDYSAQQ